MSEERDFKEFYKNNYLEIKTAESYLLSVIADVLNVENVDSELSLVEHMESRIKTPESTKLKLEKLGLETKESTALENLHDIIGVRITTHFIGDIFEIRDILANSEKVEIITEKDYISNPKPSGYRGYHIIVGISLNGFKMQCEIQLRTIAMDCWASLEHQIRYKKNIQNTKVIEHALRTCADELMSADITMEQINELVKKQKE